MNQISPKTETLRTALAAAYRELKQHEADYHHRTPLEVNNMIVDALAKPGLAQTPTLPSREQIAKIIAPELYGSPWAYPENIESDEDLNFHRNQALKQADAILALSDTSTDCEGK